MSDRPRKLLVVANETLTGDELLDAVRASVERRRRDRRRDRARERAARGLRRLRQHAPRRGGPAARPDADELSRGRDRGRPGTSSTTTRSTAVKDAIAIEEPDELIVSTHPEATSGWRRRNLLEEIRKAAGAIPVEHVVSDVASRIGAENVLVIANETVLGEPLLDRIREKARAGESGDAS